MGTHIGTRFLLYGDAHRDTLFVISGRTSGHAFCYMGTHIGTSFLLYGDAHRDTLFVIWGRTSEHAFCYIGTHIGTRFLLYRDAHFDSLILFNSFDFYWVFTSCLINIITILMMAAKLATPGLLEMKLFPKKAYEVVIFVHDVTSRSLSYDSNYLIDVVISTVWWLEMSMRELIIILFL